MSLTPYSTEDAVRSLRAGGVLLLGTDTLPGLHCRADDEQAVQRIATIKGRPAGKSLLVLAGSAAQAQAVTAPWTEAQAAAVQACWPGPFSLILPGGDVVAPAVTGPGTTLAIRVPAVAPLRQLILSVGVPLVSTSANRAERPPLLNLAAAVQEFEAEIEGFWDHGSPSNEQVKPSALVDLTSTPFKILRSGPVPFPGLET